MAANILAGVLGLVIGFIIGCKGTWRHLYKCTARGFMDCQGELYKITKVKPEK